MYRAIHASNHCSSTSRHVGVRLATGHADTFSTSHRRRNNAPPDAPRAHEWRSLVRPTAKITVGERQVEPEPCDHNVVKSFLEWSCICDAFTRFAVAHSRVTPQLFVCHSLFATGV